MPSCMLMSYIYQLIMLKEHDGKIANTRICSRKSRDQVPCHSFCSQLDSRIHLLEALLHRIEQIVTNHGHHDARKPFGLMEAAELSVAPDLEAMLIVEEARHDAPTAPSQFPLPCHRQDRRL